MAVLSWSTAARIAARELRASRGKFIFIILSVAIGVAALTGVRGFSSAFRATLLTRARSILAADVGARMFQEPTTTQQKQLEALSEEGILITPVTEMSSMASAYDTFNPLLVALKAIDPSKYPFYGKVDLAPAIPLDQALAGDNVAVGEDLLFRLHLHVSDRIKLGESTFRISSIVLNEPDRLSGSFAAGPRILLTEQQLQQTRLLGPGSRASRRFLFKLPRRDDIAVARLKERLEQLLPEAQITDYRETNPAIATALDRATGILSLISLVALVLGAIGVAMAMRTHLQQRMDTIAVMKTLGAQSSHILRIYFLQTILLGLSGGIVGVALGIGVQLTLPLLLARLLGITPDIHISAWAIATGLLTGLVTTTLFTLPPLLDIRQVKPILILRRAIDEPREGFFNNIVNRLRNNSAQLIAFVLIFIGFTVIATALSDSPTVGAVFTGSLVAVLLVLIAASAGLLTSLKVMLTRTRFSLPSSLRHGLANLYRPGNPSATLLAALGLGVMQIVAVFLIQQSFIKELRVATGPNLPNVFLIDIAKSELAGITTLLKHQPTVQGNPEFIPIVSSRILSIDGIPSAQLKLKNLPRRMLQSIPITWSESLPEGTTVVQGNFWRPGTIASYVAIEEHRAKRMNVHVGTHIVFDGGGIPIDATVVAIVEHDGQHAYARSDFILPPTPLQTMPVVYYGGVHVNPSHVGELQQALYVAYPTITIINVAQALETLRNVLLQVTLVVQFLAGFSIFAGLVILASAISGTRYRRIREVVVLKTLGATRRHMITIFSIEFAVLGLVAGFVGILFANIVASILLTRFTLAYHFNLVVNLIALILIAMLTVITGWLASHRVLGQKPLQVLREE